MQLLHKFSMSLELEVKLSVSGFESLDLSKKNRKTITKHPFIFFNNIVEPWNTNLFQMFVDDDIKFPFIKNIFSFIAESTLWNENKQSTVKTNIP